MADALSPAELEGWATILSNREKDKLMALAKIITAGKFT